MDHLAVISNIVIRQCPFIWMNGLEIFFNEHYSKLFIYTNYQLINLITNWSVT